jgi:cyclase
MSKTVRIVPRLDIKGSNLVKGIHLEGLRVLGAPEEFARYYYEQGADELLYMDIVASLYNRNSLHTFVTRTARDIFIPLIVGGGLRTIDDIRAILCAGADKVCLNTAAVNNEEIIRDASRTFGSSTVVVSIEAIRQPNGVYLVYTDNGRQDTGREVVAWARRAAELGAGEILVTSVDREGTGKGYDLVLTRAVTDAVSIPVIACGGAGSAEDVAQVVKEGHADAISLASVLHYDFVGRHPTPDSHSGEGNRAFLQSGKSFSTIRPLGLRELKERVMAAGVVCRS